MDRRVDQLTNQQGKFLSRVPATKKAKYTAGQNMDG